MHPMNLKYCKTSSLAVLSFTLLLSVGLTCNAQKKERVFIDTLDNAFDISHYMYNLNGLLPIVSPITEPAVGFGGALAALYFIPKKSNKNNKFQMPDIVGVAGGLTENGTWFAGAGYFGFWKDDHIRYRGVVGYGDVNLKYYGNGGDFLNNNPIGFALNSFGFLQQAMFRISESRFMLGGKYIFTKTEVSVFNETDIPWFDPRDFNLQNSGLGVIAEYENFDNFLSPNKGLKVNLDYIQYLEIMGGDRNYGRTVLYCYFYKPMFSNKLISGLRLESQFALGKTPFYANPFISLRGIPAMRYQGETTALVETEQLYLIGRRWGAVGFAGYGAAINMSGEDNTTSHAWNVGTGFRYLIARRLGLRMGIDVAKSPDDWGVYIIFGSAWLR
jgi:hypothetical protein